MVAPRAIRRARKTPQSVPWARTSMLLADACSVRDLRIGTGQGTNLETPSVAERGRKGPMVLRSVVVVDRDGERCCAVARPAS
jgi:hypothetical protein